MFIQVKNLSKNYGKQSAVQDLNFRLEEGQIVGFLGPNGAGKSTTLKMMMGLIRPSDGSILIDGKDPQEQEIALKKQIGYLAENNPLYPDMYVREFLAFIGNIHQLKNLDQRIQEVIEWVGLQKEAHKKIQELSKGYQQRVGIAMAILHNPSILILDEPTRGLDYEAKSQLTRILIQFAATFGRAVVLATHDVELVAELASRVIFVADGDIVADGSTLEVLLSSPAFAPQVAKVMSPQPWLRVKDVVTAIQGLQ
jgi:ABC-2 type transport system ATP-binding protein